MQNKPNYIGLDLHKKYTYFTVVGSEGEILEQSRINNNKSLIQQKFNRYFGNSIATVESTFNSYWLIDCMKDCRINTVMAHPLKLKAIISTSNKNDKIDSYKLANLLRINMLPQGYISTEEERKLKDIIRYRFSLVDERTKIKLKVKNLLLRNCIFEYPIRDVFCMKGIIYLKSLKTELKDHEYLMMLDYLDLIEHFNEKIKKVDLEIDLMAKSSYEAKLLMSIPGVGSIVAMTVLSEIGTIERFEDSRRFCSYIGLTPRVKSSGDKTVYGGIKKEGGSLVRRVLGQGVIHLIKEDQLVKDFYERIEKKKGKMVAKVASMRKMGAYIFRVLKNKQNFEELTRGSLTAEVSI